MRQEDVYERIAEWLITSGGEEPLYFACYDGSPGDILDSEEIILRWVTDIDVTAEEITETLPLIFPQFSDMTVVWRMVQNLVKEAT